MFCRYKILENTAFGAIIFASESCVIESRLVCVENEWIVFQSINTQFEVQGKYLHHSLKVLQTLYSVVFYFVVPLFNVYILPCLLTNYQLHVVTLRYVTGPLDYM